jgi:anti-anti-sigma factor
MLHLAQTDPSHGSAAVRLSGTTTTIVLSGEIDLLLREPFQAVLEQTAGLRPPVEVDCGDVTFFSAEGIRFLAALRSQDEQRLVRVVRPAVAVRRVLTVCGISADPLRMS